MKSKPYRPSNGTEGCWFESQFCDRCAKENVSKEQFCHIHNRAILYDLTEQGGANGVEVRFPTEWVEIDGKPQCTAFVLRTSPEEEEQIPETIPVAPGQLAIITDLPW